MADQIQVFRVYGNTAQPTLTLGGVTCWPCCCWPSAPEQNLIEYRSRGGFPENGSGPYFHALKTCEYGITGAWKINNIFYATNMSYDTGFVKHYTYSPWISRSIVVAATKYYYVLNWQYYESPTSLDRWKCLSSAYALCVDEPITTSTAYGATLSKQWNWGRSDSGAWDWDSFYSFAYELVRETINGGLSAKEFNKKCSVSCTRGQASSYHESNLRIEFRYNELDVFEWHCLTGGLSNHCGSLATSAYIAACDNLPQADTNSIANVLEIASSLAGLLKGDFKSPKGIKDLWLGYRYSYCTTKADIEEYAEFTRRLLSLANADAITSRGQAEGRGISCQTTIVVRRDLCLPADAKSWLKSTGFKLSAANVWDMVPYSFVVDWFLHIGDILSYFESYNNAVNLPVEEVWNSFRTNYDNQNTYFRVPGRSSFRLPYVTYCESTSGKVIGKRILDSIALFT